MHALSLALSGQQEDGGGAFHPMIAPRAQKIRSRVVNVTTGLTVVPVAFTMGVTMASKPPSTLGERVVWARSVVNLSAKELQRLADLKSPTVYLIEDETQRRMPRAEALIRLAQVFGTTVEWLVNGEGDAPTLEQVAIAHARAVAAFNMRIGALKPTGT